MNNALELENNQDLQEISSIHQPRTYNKKQQPQQEEMKLYSVYAARGWERVEGTIISENEGSAKHKTLKLLGAKDEDGIIIIVNEIKTGIRLIR